MLYIAEYPDAAPIILDAANDEHAVAVLQAHGHEMPMRLHEVSPGTFCAELYVADDDAVDYGDEVPNPANHSQTGFAFEPFEATAQWLTNWLKNTNAAHTAETSEG